MAVDACNSASRKAVICKGKKELSLNVITKQNSVIQRCEVQCSQYTVSFKSSALDLIILYPFTHKKIIPQKVPISTIWKKFRRYFERNFQVL